ncbi:MAG: hypothetical protein H6816_12120 [Phycisphaerales bacterium]|nr:hypothetical protein [Phycisphaerales bacterium]
MLLGNFIIPEVVAQGTPKFDIESIIWIAVLVLSGIGSMVKKYLDNRRGETIDAEIDDDHAPRPIARPPHGPRPAAPQRPVPQRPAPPRQPLAQRPAPPQRPATPHQPVTPRAPIARPPLARSTPPARPPLQPRQSPYAAPQPPTVPQAVVAAQAAEAARRAADHRAMKATPPKPPAAPSVPVVTMPAGVGNIALTAQNLRQAIILSEIVAPPVALRTPENTPFAPLG